MIRATFRALTLFIALLCLSIAAQGDTLNVPTPAYPTIQAAINAAVPGDTVLLADGTYTGPGNRDLNFGGKDITVRSQSGDPTRCILDCQGSGRGFVFVSGETAASIVSGLTIRNGQSSGNNIGGGMYMEGCYPTITHCIFTSNTATEGGAIFLDGSYATITYCTFTRNTASNSGGAMCIENFCEPAIGGCTFTGNTANTGGAIFLDGCYPQFASCVFAGNNAAFEGGVVYTLLQAQAYFENCTFTGNTAASGALIRLGIWCTENFDNCIVWGNTTQTPGAGTVDAPFGGAYYDYVIFFYGDLQDLGSTVLYGVEATFDADPLFVRNPSPGQDGVWGTPDDDYGDLHLQWGSPAIDSGLDATVPPFPINSSGLPLDLDGNPRIRRAHADMGAYEYQNQAPLVNAGGNQTVTATHSGNPATDTASLTLNGSATDPENDALTFQWSDSANTVVSTNVSLPLTLPPGTYSYTLTATDFYAAAGSQSVLVMVNPAPNQAPTANSQSVTLNQDTSLGITLTGSDPDGDSLTYTLASGPSQGTLSGTAPNLTYAPNTGYVGSDSFTVTVTDPYGAVSNIATVSLTVKDTTTPVITLNGSNPMTVNQGSIFTDPGATAVDNVDGTVPVSISGAVNTAVPGNYILTYSAQDAAGNKTSKTRTVNVIAAAPKVSVKLTAIGQLLQVVGVVVTINNGGSTTVSNVKITSASLIDVKALLVVPNGFSLGAGKSADVALAFYPLRKGQKGTLSITGSYSGGTFTLTQNVTIP